MSVNEDTYIDSAVCLINTEQCVFGRNKLWEELSKYLKSVLAKVWNPLARLEFQALFPGGSSVNSSSFSSPLFWQLLFCRETRKTHWDINLLNKVVVEIIFQFKCIGIYGKLVFLKTLLLLLPAREKFAFSLKKVWDRKRLVWDSTEKGLPSSSPFYSVSFRLFYFFSDEFPCLLISAERNVFGRKLFTSKHF